MTKRGPEGDGAPRWHGWLRLWARVAAGTLPADERARWREEWLGDLRAMEAAGVGVRRRAVWALGVAWAALSFRWEGWTMDGWFREVRTAIRGLLHRPAFTLLAVLTLGLGIGANTAIFSVVNGVVLEPLPYPESERLVSISTAFPSLGFEEFWMSPPEYLELSEQARSFEAIAGFRPITLNVGGGEQPERVSAVTATASIFDVLQVQPAIGRSYTSDEDLPASSPVALLSWEFWQRSFGGDRAVLGSTIDVDGTTTEVIGVMPEGFDLEGNGIELWQPSGIDPTNRQGRGSHWLEVVARLRTGVTVLSAERELAALVQGWATTIPGAGHVPSPQGHPLGLKPLQEDVVGDVRGALITLLGVVGFVLLIACANVGNLLLARAEDRQKEVAVRVALGAGRGRLLRQFLTEGLVLSFAGALVGLGVGWMSLVAMKALSPGEIPRLAEVHLDGTVLLATTAISLAVGVFFGLAPARHVLSGKISSAIRDGSGRTTDTAGRRNLRSALIASEMAMALVLAVGAGLMIRSFGELTRVEPGFDPESAVAFQLHLPQTAYPGAPESSAFLRQLEEEMEARPEFSEVVFTSGIPTAQPLAANDTEFESVQRTPGGPPHNVDYWTTISAGYIRAMGMNLVEGREFEAGDDANTTPVLLVNQSLVDKFYSGREVLGERMRPCCGSGPWYTVMGVVEDVKQGGLDEESGTELFLLDRQVGASTVWVIARTTGRPEAAMSAARESVWALNGSLPLAQLRPLNSFVGDAMARRRFLTTLMVGFAGLALLLAAVGTYGVMSYSVTQRSREIGIRMAMGAESGSVVRLILGQGVRVAGVGLLIGLFGAWALTDFIDALLYGVQVTDPVSFVLAPVVLGMVALVACWIPARRATRVDPVTVLKAE